MKLLFRNSYFKSVVVALIAVSVLLISFSVKVWHLKGNRPEYCEKNSFLLSSVLLIKLSNISNEIPEGEKSENQEDFNNLNEEFDFFKNQPSCSIFFCTPTKSNNRILKEEKFILLFHPDLLVPPPKS